MSAPLQDSQENNEHVCLHNCECGVTELNKGSEGKKQEVERCEVTSHKTSVTALVCCRNLCSCWSVSNHRSMCVTAETSEVRDRQIEELCRQIKCTFITVYVWRNWVGLDKVWFVVLVMRIMWSERTVLVITEMWFVSELNKVCWIKEIKKPFIKI